MVQEATRGRRNNRPHISLDMGIGTWYTFIVFLRHVAQGESATLTR